VRHIAWEFVAHKAWDSYMGHLVASCRYNSRWHLGVPHMLLKAWHDIVKLISQHRSSEKVVFS
jgi:hypothetical protein